MTDLNRQIPILRIVEGAVINTLDAHPRWSVSVDRKLFARSVAKRASGTVTAAWPELLAAARSGPGDVAAGARHHTRLGDQTTSPRGRAVPRSRRTPMARLHRELSRQIGFAKLAGDQARADLLIEVLKLMARI